MTRTHADLGAPALVRALEAYLMKYVSFTDPAHAFVAALWALGSHCWEHFDVYPYLVVTSATKRSGKTRLFEVLSFVCRNPFLTTGITPAAMFRLIRGQHPTLFNDEAEDQGSEAQTLMRQVQNVGYRKGQHISRVNGEKGTVEHWPTYCAKAYALIGDVYDTLRDRSIVVTLQRKTSATWFTYTSAQEDGAGLRDQVEAWVKDQGGDTIAATFAAAPRLAFLQDRDAEIWQALFTLCQLACPSRKRELERIATDLAAEKTAPARKATHHKDDGAEDAATFYEYGDKLVRDLLVVIGEAPGIPTKDVLDRLYALPTGPWRKFRGEGLTDRGLSRMLKRFPGVEPRNLKRGGRVVKGYKRRDVAAAVASL